MMMARYPCRCTVVRHHTASLNVLPPRATRAAEVGSNPEGGPTGELAEDAAGPAAAGFLGYPFEPILSSLIGDDVLVDAQYD